MYNRELLQAGGTQIEAQIYEMPRNYTSVDFYSAFERNHSHQYETFIRIYTQRGHDRPHAIQLVNSQLMHTVNDRFSHLTRKVRTVPNPKGGNMSEWVRLGKEIDRQRDATLTGSASAPLE
jgi:hypothetical protein